MRIGGAEDTTHTALNWKTPLPVYQYGHDVELEITNHLIALNCHSKE